ncbi:MAG: hypothetical protein RLZZ612_1850 [Pseudomonadota bacterium]|jgi:hypothetical protein
MGAIYQKSQTGQEAFQKRSPEISAKQRSAFLLFDGKRKVQDVLAAGLGITQADVDDLVTKGFLVSLDAAGTVDAAAPAAPAPAGLGEGVLSAQDKQDLYRAAYPVAVRLSSQLGLRGFKLNLAVEAASGFDDLFKLLPELEKALGAEKVKILRTLLKID